VNPLSGVFGLLLALLPGTVFAAVDETTPARDPAQRIDEEYTKKIKEYTTETGAPTALMELAYRLAVDESPYVASSCATATPRTSSSRASSKEERRSPSTPPSWMFPSRKATLSSSPTTPCGAARPGQPTSSSSTRSSTSTT
jgi:hypothetical protein